MNGLLKHRWKSLWLTETICIFVLEDGEVVPKYPEDSMEGFDLTEVFCLGCSWHGSPKRLVKR